MREAARYGATVDELADALDIKSDIEGWVIGMKLTDDEKWEDAKD